MKIAACHVLREQSTTALLAASQFAICAQSSKGMKKQEVGKQENGLLFENPLTEMTGFTNKNKNNNNNNLLCSCEITALIHLLAILFAVDESTAI